jgi:hypothetical protein
MVTRADKGGGLNFTTVYSVTLQGKEKAASLGGQPKLTGPVNKLPSVSIARTLLRDADAKILAAYESGTVEYLLPPGLPKTASGDPAALWQGVRMAYKKAEKDKTPTDFDAATLVAVLPGDFEQLRKICTDQRALEILGGKGKAFQAQVEWLSAAVKAFPNEPALAPLEKYVEEALRQRHDMFESGVANLEVLEQGLTFSKLSEAAYPSRPEQQRLRKALADRRSWLDRKMAVLKAFAAAEQWDAYLNGARDFEIFEHAFPEVMKQRSDALKQSLQIHRKAGHDRLKEGEFSAAYREYRLASLRAPNDTVLLEETREAWSEYSRRVAVDRQTKRERLSAGQHDAVERDLYFAEQNRQAKNLDEAYKNVVHAESLLIKALPNGATTPETLKVLYKKAEVLGAQGRISEALTTLDQYDLNAVDEERAPANQLRNQLLYQLDKTLKEVKANIQKALPEGRFNLVRSLSEQGLKVKEDDADLLFYAGTANYVTRRTKESRSYLERYLAASSMLEGAAEQRVKVRRLLPGLNGPGSSASPAAETGDRNWMSGKKLPANVYYCPLTLAFQPRIEHIEASNKMRASFEWDGWRLRSITPAFEKSDQATGEKKISFGYDERVPQVASVGFDQPAPEVASNDPDEAYLRSALVTLNNPNIDPTAVERLTGMNVAVGFAGNRFFNPFIWEKVYSFRFAYDAQGRAVQAREISGPRGTPGSFVAEFDWEGNRLTAVRGYEGTDEKHRSKTYERTLQYEGGRLMSEDIDSQGRQAHIKYVYKGDKLATASCDKGSGLDGRSRQVFFAGN